jgi:hypothetical protein
MLAMALLLLPGCSEEDGETPPVNGDDTPPELIASSPFDGETGVSRTGPYWFAFSETMDVESVQDNITASPDFGHDIHANAAADTFWLTPHAILGEGASHTFTVGPACEDEVGNMMTAAVEIGFTTTAVQDMDPPTVEATYPDDGASGINSGQPVRITFSEPVAYPGQWDTQMAIMISPYPIDGYFVREGNDLVVHHVPFPPNTTIEMTVTTFLEDIAGNTLEAPYEFSFTTLDDIERPYLETASPTNGTTGVTKSRSEIILTFSEPMDPEFPMPPDNVDARMILALSDEPLWNDDMSELTLPLIRGLQSGCTYWALFEDVTDMAGNPIDPNPTYYSFTTAGTSDWYPVSQGDLWYFIQGMFLTSRAPELDASSDRRVIENYNPVTGEFEEVWYQWNNDNWMIYERTYLQIVGDTLYHAGREEYIVGVLETAMIWDTPMPFLVLPPQDNLGSTWDVSTGADLGEGITMELAGSVTIDADLTWVISPPSEAIFSECVSWVLSVSTTFYDDGVPFDESGFVLTTFLAEGIGPVMTVEDNMDASPLDTAFVTGWDID